MSDSRAVPRDLLPLPALHVSRDRRGCKGRVRRLQRFDALSDASNEVIWALNYLANVGSFVHVSVSESQRLALDSIREACASFRVGLQDVDPQTALRALLGTKAASYEGAWPSQLASLDTSLLSLPQVAGQVELEHVLPDEEKVKLINLHSMFLSSQEFNDRVKEEGRARAYIDPGLQEKSSKYEALIQELYQRKLVAFGHRCLNQVGIFAVWKKSGKQRLIIDCRSLNQRMVAPPHTHLASTAAVAEFYVAGDERLYFSGQDIADAFYQFAIPWELSKYLGLPPVRAGALDVSMVEGKFFFKGFA